MAEIDLHSFRSNVHSQCGEDGILEKLFGELGIQSGSFCEFGAWDGQHLSNSRALLDRGWRGVFIEGDETRYKDLVSNVRTERAELILAFVEAEGPRSLDEILTQGRIVGTAGQLDFLSIDIDSDDLAMWKGLKKIRPRVVCIEFNPTIPLDVEYTNPPGENKGNSAAAIHRFATGAGYDLVATTQLNLIYLDRTHRPSTIRARALVTTDLPAQLRYFWGYDGSLIVARTSESGQDFEFACPEVVGIPWKTAVFAQPTPRAFRRFDQRGIRDRVFRAYSYVSATMIRPVASLRFAAGRLARRR